MHSTKIVSNIREVSLLLWSTVAARCARLNQTKYLVNISPFHGKNSRKICNIRTGTESLNLCICQSYFDRIPFMRIQNNCSVVTILPVAGKGEEALFPQKISVSPKNCRIICNMRTGSESLNPRISQSYFDYILSIWIQKNCSALSLLPVARKGNEALSTQSR